MRQKYSRRLWDEGFTLIELLIFIAIFSIAMVGFIGVLIAVTRVQVTQASRVEVEQQSQFLLQQFQYYIQGARLVDMTQDVPAGSLQLRESVSAQDPTIITASNGVVTLQQGDGSAQALTSAKVTVSNLSFTRHFNIGQSVSAYGSESVSYSFTVAASTTNPEMQYSQTVQSSVAVLSPVAKIALLQKAQTDDAGTGITTISSTYPTGNETGDLLLAVISNTASADSSLVGWWKFDDGSGTSAIDSSGNGNNGTLINGPTWAIDGKISGALSFNGVNQYVDMGNVLNAGSGDLTVAAWFKTSVAGDSDQGIVAKRNNSFGNEDGYSITINAPGSDFGDGVTGEDDNGPGVKVSADVWHQMVMTISRGSELKSTYIDGTLDFTDSISGIGSQNNSLDLRIGASGNGRYFNGLIDDVRIYNRALSSSEVAALYANPGPSVATTSLSQVGSSTWTEIANTTYPAYNQETTIYAAVNYNSELVGWWTLDDGSGTTAADSSGSGNGGTLTGSPLPTWTKSGEFNGAINLSAASGQYIDLGGPSALIMASGSSYTVSAWVNPASLPSSGNLNVIFSRGDGNNADIYDLVLANNWECVSGLGWGFGFDRPEGSPGTQFQCLGANSTVNVGQWYNVIGVWNAASFTQSLYVNGSFLASTTPAGAFSDLGSGDVAIGAFGCCGNPDKWDGTIDDVRLYDRPLNASEIEGLYHNTGPTVTATFGASVTNPSLFLYEYRGASTSSSFDASSTLNISNTAAPSSGSAHPTSSVELIFGALYSNPFTETPVAGSGFTLEATSSVSQSVIEDENVYVTGPVSAGWTYSQTTPSSAATVVTFK
jgi:type II secretory pathway component PulJ